MPTKVAFERLRTVVGLGVGAALVCLNEVPIPSSPKKFCPQQRTVSSEITAQAEEAKPAAIPVARRHVPAEQEMGQPVPQLPQLSLLLSGSMHVPLQSMGAATGHAHWPPEQV